MRPIPPAHKKILDTDPRFKMCARKGIGCSGRITIEHAFIYAGRQINEIWAYVPLCWHHHLGEGLDKNFNRWLSLRHATEQDLAKYPRTDWKQLIHHLSFKYGPISNDRSSAGKKAIIHESRTKAPHDESIQTTAKDGGSSPSTNPQRAQPETGTSTSQF